MISLVSKRKAAEQVIELFSTPYMKTKKRWPTIFDVSEPIVFKLNNQRVKGYRWNKNQPHKILILHGFGSAAHKFHQYVAPLVKKGYEVLAFDAPAHGSSEGDTVNALQYKQMIENIIAWYGPINGFMAHSFGGIALSLALEQNLPDENTRIVFIAPATETVSAVDQAFKMLHLNDKGVRKEFENLIIKQTGHPIEWYSMNRAVQNIPCKILWIHDEEDYVTPIIDIMPLKNKKLPNIEFLITKGLGHRRIYHDTRVKNTIIDFL